MSPATVIIVFIGACYLGWWADERSTAPNWVRYPIMFVSFIIVAGFLSFTWEGGEPMP